VRGHARMLPARAGRHAQGGFNIGRAGAETWRDDRNVIEASDHGCDGGPTKERGGICAQANFAEDADWMEGSELGVTPTVVPVLVAERGELKRRARDVLRLRSASAATELGAGEPDVQHTLHWQQDFSDSRHRHQALRVRGGKRPRVREVRSAHDDIVQGNPRTLLGRARAPGIRTTPRVDAKYLRRARGA